VIGIATALRIITSFQISEYFSKNIKIFMTHFPTLKPEGTLEAGAVSAVQGQVPRL
jgi:hypothetical protein